MRNYEAVKSAIDYPFKLACPASSKSVRDPRLKTMVIADGYIDPKLELIGWIRTFDFPHDPRIRSRFSASWHILFIKYQRQ